MKLQWIVILVSFGYANAISCDVRDTINVSSGTLDFDGNLHHNGLIYKNNQFAKFDFIYANYSSKLRVQPHLRGCICELKNCLRICRFCDENDELSCVKSNKLLLPIDGDENEMKEISIKDDKFGVVEGDPCKVMIEMEPLEFDEDKWIFKVKI